MSKAVRIDAVATEEIDEAIERYERARRGLGLEFLDEVATAMASLREPGPECGLALGVPRELGVRRKLLKRFPYVIVFIELDDVVRVIAVAHGARRPAYWRRRIGQG